MKRLLKLNNRGDTIVEVLLAIAVVSSVIGASFVSANRSLKGTQDSQERSEALKLAEAQVEQLQNLNRTGAANVFAGNPLFCIRDGTRHDFGATTLPALENDNLTSPDPYPTQCDNIDPAARYHLSILYEPGDETTQYDDVFIVRARWNGPTGRNEEVRLVYRLHEQFAITEGCLPSEDCDPAPPPCENLGGDLFFELWDLAITADNDPNNAIRTVDTRWHYQNDGPRYFENWTNPDLDLGSGSLTGYGDNFRIDPDCNYSIPEMTLWCGGPNPLTSANWSPGNINPPPLSNCQEDQVNETFRMSFYGGRVGGQCDYDTLLAYVNIGDHFTEPDPASTHEATVNDTDVNVATANPYFSDDGDPNDPEPINCMEMVAGCYHTRRPGNNQFGVEYHPPAPQTPAPGTHTFDDPLCPVIPPAANAFYDSSIFLHSFNWRETVP